MMGHHFDTHQMVKSFIKSGIKEPQAEAIIGAIAQAREFDASNLATKMDLIETQAKLKQEIAGLRTEMHQEIGNLRADMLKWGIGMVITTIFGTAGVMIAILKAML